MKRLILVLFLIFIFLQVNCQWLQLGNPLSNYLTLKSLSSDSKGNVYAAGALSSNGNLYIAKWDGTTWKELGNSSSFYFYGGSHGLYTDLNDNIYATYTKSFTINAISKFDGNNWADLGGNNSFLANGYIKRITSDNQGNIYVAGNFTGQNGKPYIAKWNGLNWSQIIGINGWMPIFPNSSANGFNDILADKYGNLYATGGFTNAAGMYYVAKWDGISWTELKGNNVLNSVSQIQNILIDSKGNIYVTNCLNQQKNYAYISKWDGVSWNEVFGLDEFQKNGSNGISAAAIDSKDNIYLSFGAREDINNFYTLKWNGLNWFKLFGYSNCNSTTTTKLNIFAMCTSNNDNLYAVGNIANHNCEFVVAKYDKPYLVGVKNENTIKMGIEIFPNPTSTKLHFNLGNTTNQKFNLNLTSGLGQTIITKLDADLNEGLDISNLSNGIYFLKIQNQFAQKTFKVVKE